MIKIKTAVIYGDSISTREFGDGGYENQLKENLNIENIFNHAISSSGLSSTTPNNLIGLLNDKKHIHPEADLIIIWHGTNDWYWNAPLNSDDNESSFTKDLISVIKKIQETCPNADIAFLTPLFRFQAADGSSNIKESYINENLLGYTLKDYYNIIMNLSIELGYTVIDMRKLTNFHYFNFNKYMPDLIHPSKDGYKKIANILTKQIYSLFQFEK